MTIISPSSTPKRKITLMTNHPSWFSRIDISACKEHFEETEHFADQAGRKQQFLKTLRDLVAGEIVDDELTCWGRPCKMRVRLYRDFAPHSFEFVKEVMYEGKSEWEFQFNGGIIFHGPHDNGGDGGAPTYSVSLSPQDGWSVHT